MTYVITSNLNKTYATLREAMTAWQKMPLMQRHKFYIYQGKPMTSIKAEIICDSVNKQGKRITTLKLRYPRCIHSEFMTHRQFSRNSSSSRAIPVSRLIDDVLQDPFVPLFWGSNKPGMQAGDEINAPVLHRASLTAYSREGAWLQAMHQAVDMARAFAGAGYHKQIVNRLLEPFAHINVLVTATEFDNFFALRDHPDAEPHIQILAQEMKKALSNSTPKQLNSHEWHLPFMYDDMNNLDVARSCSVARCARVSYLTHDGNEPSIQQDLILFDRLRNAAPPHASPFEHICTPLGNRHPAVQANLNGWISLRQLLEI